MIKKRLVMLVASLLLLYNFELHAHSAAIATYKIEQTEADVWHLTVSVPLGALHLALLQHYDEADLWVTERQYNADIAINYLMTTSQITANNNQQILLKSQRYTLDNHQSNFVFEMQHMPTNITTLNFHIPAMKENKGHINIVRLVSKFGNKKAILQSNNNYQYEIKI